MAVQWSELLAATFARAHASCAAKKATTLGGMTPPLNCELIHASELTECDQMRARVSAASR